MEMIRILCKLRKIKYLKKNKEKIQPLTSVTLAQLPFSKKNILKPNSVYASISLSNRILREIYFSVQVRNIYPVY